MSADGELKIQNFGDIVEITLNRPSKRNALTRSLLTDLLAVLKALPAGTRMLVLSASGPVFCAGMDLKEMEQAATQQNAAEIWQADSQLYRDVLETLFFLPCPTLCVLQGPSVAGGVGLVLACDIVFGTEAASFTLPEPKRGITASMVSALLKYRISPGPAGYLLLSCLTVGAVDAVRLGLIHQLQNDSDVASARQQLESSILAAGPLALQSTKRQLNLQLEAQFKRDLDAAMELSAEARGLSEAREGLQAYLERRSPDWTPKQVKHDSDDSPGS